MDAEEALDFVRTHGIVLMSAHGPVPTLAEAIAGGPIRGSWWAHPEAHAIFRLCGAVSDSPDVLVCRLVDGKVTFVHRRLWPALVCLAPHLPRGRLAAVHEEHTPRGTHRVRRTPFPRWVPADVREESERLGEQAALAAVGERLVRQLVRKGRRAT